MELQNVNVKFYLEDESNLEPDEFNPIFQTWIQKGLTEELLIDVADYLHVPEGPGMILIGLEADYSLDHGDGRWGLKYNRKYPQNGSNLDRLISALKTALLACQRLEEDEHLMGKIKFQTKEFEIFINDRALAPNSPETFEATQGEISQALRQLLGSTDFSLEVYSDPRSRFGVTVKASNNQSIASLLKNLS
ncbi:MAG: hypothetical protein R3351_09115 [Nitrospirales bacterium]|nr:hypothetical protein [Nitrospirales bacterium]